MATRTLGTNATTSLTAVLYNQSETTLLPADLATVSQGIKDDLNVAHPVWPGAFSRSGLLYIPNRGVLKVLPGDYVAYDNVGGAFLVTAYSILSGAWTHS